MPEDKHEGHSRRLFLLYKDVIGCLWDGDPGWRDSPGSWEAGWNRAPSCVWLYLLLVQYETMSCLVACMNESFGSLAHGPVHHACIAPSHIAREGEIEKTDPCRMEGEKGMEGCRQTVRDRQPNKAKVHDTVLDEPLDNPSEATNHPLRGEAGRMHSTPLHPPTIFAKASAPNSA
jgi:hypothetical protein